MQSSPEESTIDSDTEYIALEYKVDPLRASSLRGSASALKISQSAWRPRSQSEITEHKINVQKQHSNPVTNQEISRAGVAMRAERPTLQAMLGKFMITRAFQMIRLPSQRQTFFCTICMENADIDKSFAFSGHGGCSHRFCKECLRYVHACMYVCMYVRMYRHVLTGLIHSRLVFQLLRRWTSV
jgi:hypothetical protein